MHAQTSFVSGSFSEHSFNDALAAALKDRRHYWRTTDDAVTSERTDVLLANSSLRPDILVRPRHGNPIIIEVEINSDPDPDARRRVGQRTTFGKQIYSTIALRAPELVRGWSTPAEAAHMLSRSRRGQNPGFNLEFAVLQQGVVGEIERWPRQNFITGNVDDLADLCETAATPHHMIETFAEDVAKLLIGHADALRDEISEDVASEIATAIGQGRIKQGLRMACCIWMSTLRLHDLLATTDELKARGLKSIAQIRRDSIGDVLTLSDVRDAWETILDYNYRSIFGPALKALVDTLPPGAGADTLDNLSRLAEQVTAQGLGDHVDFAGELFPKLLEDRKETAANYTLPTTAAMLARIAVDQIPIKDWSDESEVSNIKIADFACGTGTLLRAAYQRIRKNYEAASGDNVAGLHKRMMEGGITGTDINPLAAHMTAACLSTIEIAQSYRDTNIGALPVRGGRTGALEFLESQQATDMLAETVEQSARDDIGSIIAAPNNAYSLVIQNPPYTAARGGRRLFDVAGITEPERSRSVKRLTNLRHRIRREGDKVTSGKAGMGADFSALADLKVKSNGTFATVLPLTAAHSASWSGLRSHFTEGFSSMVAIASATDQTSMMSSDTAMNEMLMICSNKQHMMQNGGGGTASCVSISLVFQNQLRTRKRSQMKFKESNNRTMMRGPYESQAMRLGCGFASRYRRSIILGLPWECATDFLPQCRRDY